MSPAASFSINSEFTSLLGQCLVFRIYKWCCGRPLDTDCFTFEPLSTLSSDVFLKLAIHFLVCKLEVSSFHIALALLRYIPDEWLSSKLWHHRSCSYIHVLRFKKPSDMYVTYISVMWKFWNLKCTNTENDFTMKGILCPAEALLKLQIFIYS